MGAVPIRQAAQVLGKTESTLRRWVSRGAPTARPGEPRRGAGALVDVDALKRWRSREAPTAGEALEKLAADFRAYHREGRHRIVGLKDQAAAALYADCFRFVARRMGADVQPEDIKILERLAEQV